jgi:biopolymer transport protein ExbD
MNARSFRRRSALAHWDMHFGPSMTPMVDVVMVILIFFMTWMSFVGAEWFLRTALPKQGAQSDTGAAAADPFKLPPARFEFTLSRGPDGQTVVSGEGFPSEPLDTLPARLANLAKGGTADDIVLVIRSESAVPYGDVIKAHDAAAAAGIVKVGLMDASTR